MDIFHAASDECELKFSLLAMSLSSVRPIMTRPMNKFIQSKDYLQKRYNDVRNGNNIMCNCRIHLFPYFGPQPAMPRRSSRFLFQTAKTSAISQTLSESYEFYFLTITSTFGCF